MGRRTKRRDGESEDYFLSSLNITDHYITAGEDLKRQRILWFYLPVEGITAGMICQRLLSLDLASKEPIKLFISSEGGYDVDMWAIIDMMNWIRSPVWTYCIGEVASAGTGIFAAGSKRFMFPSSKLMLHIGDASTSGNPMDIEIYIKEYKREYDRYLKLISEASGQSKKKIDARLRKGDFYLSADEAIDYGIAHEILNTQRRDLELRRKRKPKNQ